MPQPESGIRALSSLRHETWQHFEELSIRLSLSDCKEPIYLAGTDVDGFGQTAAEVWLLVFQKLTSMKTVNIYINLNYVLDAEASETIFWPSLRDFLDMLCMPAAQISGRQKPSLKLEFSEADISPGSSIWEVLLVPFAIYDKISATVNQNGHYCGEVPIDPFHLAGAFQPAQLINVILTALTSFEMQVAASARYITNFNLIINSTTSCSVLGECLHKISGTLENLEICVMTCSPEDVNLRPVKFPRLKRLHLQDRQFAFLFLGLLAENITTTPVLQSIHVEDKMSYDSWSDHLTLGGWEASIVRSLQAFVRLDERLPDGCDERIYSLFMEGEIESIHKFFSKVEALARQGSLDLQVEVSLSYGTHNPDAMAVPAQVLHISSLDCCREAISQFKLKIQSYTLDNLDHQRRLVLDNLEHLSIETRYYHGTAGRDFALLLSHLSTSELRSVEIYSKADHFQCDFKIIAHHLSSWPSLENLEVDIEMVYEEVIASKAFQELLQACEQRDLTLRVSCFDGSYRREESVDGKAARLRSKTASVRPHQEILSVDKRRRLLNSRRRR